MFREIPKLRQNPDEPKRRWFYDSNAEMDLIVWLDTASEVLSFQLFYKKAKGSQCALTWRRQTGFTHDKVDDGEGRPGKHKATPVLFPDGSFDARGVAVRFKNAGENIDPAISDFVYHKLLEYGE